MVETLNAVKTRRVSLVDELEGTVDRLLDGLLHRGVFCRDDREEALCPPGPRARVRKVLDIIECKGEEAAQTFFSIVAQLRRADAKESSEDRPLQFHEYNKVKQKHKDVLRRRSENMLFYNTRHGEKILLSEHYVNLLLVDGHQGLDFRRHEVLTFGQRRLSLQRTSGAHVKITPDKLFLCTNGKRAVKKVLVAGVAGIGKTMLVQKMLFDFGGNKVHAAFDFVVHMTFRDLNLIDKPTTLRELILRKNKHLAKELDGVLANDDKLLIILDGFDEFRHHRSCDVDVFVTEPDEEAELVEVIGSLMQGELLPNASLLLTSRPAAMSHVPVGCIDRFVLIAGFSLTEVKDFFLRYFQDDGVAEQMFAVVKANEVMLTLCYIPAFCFIVCCILRESRDLCGESPKTMTDIYVQYLLAMLRSHTQTRTGVQGDGAGAGQQLSDTVLRLGRLGFRKLMEHQTLFYSADPDVSALEGCGLVSTFLDRTVVQEPGCTEEVYSFTHLTVQEFFAALYYAVSDQPFPDVLQQPACLGEGSNSGHLDLFNRFLSGILSARNAKLLARHFGLCCHKDKAHAHRQRMIRELRTLCENGAYILNHVQCLFEQQDSSLVAAVRPQTLKVNVGDETLSQMDYHSIKYFLNLTGGEIQELDLTGTGLNSWVLQDIHPLLIRCQRLWLGENSLDMETVQVIADVLRQSDSMTHLGIGWCNIGDDELLALSSAIRVKKTLQELWMEGNQVSVDGLLSLSDLTPDPLKKVVAIWNDLSDTRPWSSDSTKDSITVNFTDDTIWEAWGGWVLRRCEVSSNDKLVKVLHKVCNVSFQSLDNQWAKAFYRRLSALIKNRIECCTEDDMCKKLNKFERVLNV